MGKAFGWGLAALLVTAAACTADGDDIGSGGGGGSGGGSASGTGGGGGTGTGGSTSGTGGAAPDCMDGLANGDETGVDCGGPTCGMLGFKCSKGSGCLTYDDCLTGNCCGASGAQLGTCIAADEMCMIR
ncbi:hypothetical protein [Polyangium jinanense]|uniref:PE-PGRS family protein n=1 Tax=Polyangium jinanense TaxID=2829994 RepID=A0A9X3XF72_9BACT|nr:hypothetical protein [Polyangium jinanense]MDC3957766.1 hypothetical protein [Polyangium jinanense]MDC3961964.1 hypothetical protein [Polyangium jinanense]MDC3987558.1 hypothetical protein [Polyangium jinanense]